MYSREKTEKICFEIINTFLKIGFVLCKDYINEGNYEVKEYKYRPKYMSDTHYTIIFFNRSEIRLYIHKNIDGSYVDSPFQIGITSEWYEMKIKKDLNKIFKSELRTVKIASIM